MKRIKELDDDKRHAGGDYANFEKDKCDNVVDDGVDDN